MNSVLLTSKLAKDVFLTVFSHIGEEEWETLFYKWHKINRPSEKLLINPNYRTCLGERPSLSTAELKITALIDVCVMALKFGWNLESFAKQYPIKLDPKQEGEAFYKVWHKPNIAKMSEREADNQALEQLQTLSIKSRSLFTAQVVAEQEEKAKAFRNESRRYRKEQAKAQAERETLPVPVAPVLTEEEQAAIEWSKLTDKQKRAEYKKLFKL